MFAKCLFLLSTVVAVVFGLTLRPVDHVDHDFDQQVQEPFDETDVPLRGVTPDCDPDECEKRTWNLTLHRYQNRTGNWVDLALTGDDWGRSSADSNMGVKATVFDCKGRKMIRIHATIKDPIFFPHQTEVVVDDRLRFNVIAGENIALGNDGFTAMKKDTLKHDVAFTSRHLKPDEMFQVRIDQILVSKKYANAIGVTTYIPLEGKVPHHMNSIKTGTWMMYNSKIWRNGSTLKRMKISLDKLKVGDLLGVKRTAGGALHFYINGDDLGEVATGIPENVYGVFEFYGDTTQVTIVNPQ
ncbi:neuralized-like protein 4 [Ischnura elegans]|uniref:neuralized-like protein 4 n=1 Tax=Ischnura elegans TaxID=197161 RepID=UPI001ED8BA22|nr:neuralized-like protein 4 [Ischnura elegans]